MNEQRGASILEVLLSIAIVALLAPFMYGQITKASNQIRDIGYANKIIQTRETAMNFVRKNQESWGNVAQVKLTPSDAAQISDAARAVFIDKYLVNDISITDIYISFHISDRAVDAARVAKYIGGAAAIVGDDNVAYGDTWAVTAPDFASGDLVYRIGYDFDGEDHSQYLHRGTSGADDFNVMLRNLDMGGFDMFDVATVAAESADINDAVAGFAQTGDAAVTSLYFSDGAIIDGAQMSVGTMRITGDITGFRNIAATRLNDNKFVTDGNIITNKAEIYQSVNVGNNMTIKSQTQNTVDGFSTIVAHTAAVPFLYADEITFFANGITVSSELLLSGQVPLQIGDWVFPSVTPPEFSNFGLARATLSAAPDTRQFEKLLNNGWKQAR